MGEVVPEDDERVAIHILLSREARDGLNAFVDAQGVTLTALYEQWGLMCAEEGFDIDEYPQLQRVIEGARQMDAERRRRT